MPELPEFIIGDNPTSDHSNRIFITHTTEPLFIAEVFHFDINDEESQAEAKSLFEVGSSLEHQNEYIVIGVRKLMETKEHNADQLAKIMSRTGDWYFNLLKHEDEIE